MTIKESISLFLKGIIIGVANIIPGVSGGTMALIMGIYQRLIDCLGNISIKTVKSFFLIFTFKKENFKAFQEELIKIDALFLSLILIGAISALGALAKLMSYLLAVVHDPTYGFFFGLVLASVYVPFELIKKKTPLIFLSALIAITAVVALDNTLSVEDKIKKEQIKYELKQNSNSEDSPLPVDNMTGRGYVILFFAAAIAISAMILPGISGSFLLLLMGQYFIFLGAIADRNITLLAIFIGGSLAGLALFTKLLNWLLKNHHDKTMGFLTGLVIGSLWVIWPFKSSARVGDKTVYLKNILPARFQANEIITTCTIVIGIIAVVSLILIEKRNNRAELNQT